MKKKLLLLCTIGMMAASLTSCAALDGVKDVLKDTPLGGVLGGILDDGEESTNDSISNSTDDGKDDSSNTEHVHAADHIAAKDATCESVGNIEYWYCSECDGVWTDEALTEAIDMADTLVEKLAHEYTYACDAHCMNCGELTNEEAAHTIAHVEAKEATCPENGNVEYWYCSDCGSAWLDEAKTQVTNLKSVITFADHTYTYACDKNCNVCYEETNPNATHTVVHVEAKAATCTENGNVEYWYCSDCGSAWLDEAQTMVTNLRSVITFGEHSYFYPCDPVCQVCYEVTNPNATHTVVHVEAKAATCTENGNVEYWYCSDCGSAWLDEAQTQLTNQMSVKLPTVEHTAYEEDYKCDVCKKVIAPAADSTLTIAQAKKLGEALASDAYTSAKYYVTGYITSVYNTTYGNMYIVDETGAEYTIYGTYSADGKTGYSSLTDKPVAGDYVTFYGIIGNYKTAPQMKNGWMTEVVKHTECTWIDATCLEAKHCKYCGKTEGALAEHTYVNGECSVCGKVEGSAALANATLDFNNIANCTSQDTNQQVWEQNGVKLINEKASSTNSVAKYNPIRLYQGSKVIIEGTGITKIVFTCDTYKNTYANALKTSIGNIAGVTVTVSGTVVTVEFETAVNQFTIAKLSAQVRLDSIVVNPA